MSYTNDDSTHRSQDAEQAAQYLANLLGKPVLGYWPESYVPSDVVAQQLDDLLSGRVRPRSLGKFSVSDPMFSVDAPFIVVSALLNGCHEVRNEVLARIEEDDIPDHFCSRLFREIKLILASDLEGTPHSIRSLEDEIPRLWSEAKGETLEGVLKVGVYYRWMQMRNWEVDIDLVRKAIRVLHQSE